MLDLKSHDNLLNELRERDPESVLDGPVVTELYALAPTRILWILREPNGVGPWDLRESLADFRKLSSYSKWQATSGLLARVSHGLVSGLPRWGAWADEAQNCVPALRSVAVININKHGGKERVEWNKLFEASRKFEDLLERQIEMLDPHVVIFTCGPNLLPTAVRNRLCDFSDSGCAVQREGTTVWIRAYHPNQRTISHEEYYEQVRKALMSCDLFPGCEERDAP
ncbi:MAG TPA: hypothetical protein VF306_14740 [Pirellulales bacterium]